MIKYKIFPEEAKDSSQDSIVGLKLEKIGTRVVVKGLDENGHDRGGSHLIEFTSSGKIRRCVGICGCRSLALDSQHRVEIEK